MYNTKHKPAIYHTPIAKKSEPQNMHDDRKSLRSHHTSRTLFGWCESRYTPNRRKTRRKVRELNDEFHLGETSFHYGKDHELDMSTKHENTTMTEQNICNSINELTASVQEIGALISPTFRRHHQDFGRISEQEMKYPTPYASR